jgi:hypothetical protein
MNIATAIIATSPAERPAAARAAVPSPTALNAGRSTATETGGE